MQADAEPGVVAKEVGEIDVSSGLLGDSVEVVRLVRDHWPLRAQQHERGPVDDVAHRTVAATVNNQAQERAIFECGAPRGDDDASGPGLRHPGIGHHPHRASRNHAVIGSARGVAINAVARDDQGLPADDRRDCAARDIPAAVAARMRRQEALYDPSTQFEFMLTEAALRWPAGERGVMAAQYDRIASVSTLTNVKLGIMPLGEPVSAIPWCDVNIYDELGDQETPVVDIELPHGEVWVTEPDDVRLYLDLVVKLWQSALTGDDARALLTRLTRDSL